MRRYPARTRKGSKTPQESGETNHVKPEQGERQVPPSPLFLLKQKLTKANFLPGAKCVGNV